MIDNTSNGDGNRDPTKLVGEYCERSTEDVTIKSGAVAMLRSTGSKVLSIVRFSKSSSTFYTTLAHD